MKKINIGSNIKIYWKIWRGANKVTEDFNSMNTNLKVFLVGSGDTYYLEPSINNTIDPGYDVIELDIPAFRLDVGVYNIKAICEKNGGRNVLTSARASVLYLTDSPSEAPIQDEEVRIVSLVESFGRDGMSAYETAVMRGVNEGITSEIEWVKSVSIFNEKERLANEEERISNEDDRIANEAERREAEKRRERFKEGLIDKVDEYKPIVINGNVTNAPDEEDITSEGGLLKFKNRPAFNDGYGRGYIILRAGTPIEAQITKANTIYEIRHDFNLSGKTLTMPEGCILRYNGGSIYGSSSSQLGTIVCDNTIIEGVDDRNNYVEYTGSYEYSVDSRIESLVEDIENDVNNHETRITRAEDNISVLEESENRFYSESNPNGMGYMVLRSDASIFEQIAARGANTIYEIRYDFDLGGFDTNGKGKNPLNMPLGCVLRFNGGSIKNGEVVCNNTAIEGSLDCLNSAILTGTFTSGIKLSWLGIYGDNSNNDERIKDLVLFSSKIVFELDSDVVLNSSDVTFPTYAVINGCGHTIAFTSDKSNKGLIVLSEGCKLNNITIRSENADYQGTIVTADTRINKVHTFYINDVQISGKWNENNQYLSTGLKLIASNASDKEDTADNDPSFKDNRDNHITGCFINGLKITWVNVGIDIKCRNKNYAGDEHIGHFAWLNELYVRGLYVSAAQYGVKTYYLNTATNNKPDSIGPLHFSQYEYQAIGTKETKPNALMFRHEGNWTLEIISGFCWDTLFRGDVINGTLNTFGVYGCWKTDSASVTDNTGTYKLVDSVRIYGNGNYRKMDYLKTADTYRHEDYAPGTALDYWRLGCSGKNFEFYDRKRQFQRIFAPLDALTFSDHIRLENGAKVSKSYYAHKGGGNSEVTYSTRYGINTDVVLLSNTPDFQSSEIIGTTNNSMLCVAAAAVQLTEGYRYKGRLTVGFNDSNGNQITYVDYKKKYDFLNRKSQSPVKSINYMKNVSSKYVDENDMLYIDWEGECTRTVSYLTIIIEYMYKRYIPSADGSNFVTYDGNIINIKIPRDAYVHSTTYHSIKEIALVGLNTSRPDTKNIEKGFRYFDTTLNAPIWWNGSNWIYANGRSIHQVTSGTFGEKPENPERGFAFFCTNKSTATEGSTNGIMIYYKGDGVWVDAVGRVVD